MQYRYVLIGLFIVQPILAQETYRHFFTGERLRYDYITAGNDTSISITDGGFFKEPLWGGSSTNLIDTFRYGEMMLEVYDSLSGIQIYSRGYSTLFKEWQTTQEAETQRRAFKESVIMPYPFKTVAIKINDRQSDLSFKKIHTVYFNPSSVNITALSQPVSTEVRFIDSTGLPDERTDIVFVAEGYDLALRDKFFTDARRFVKVFYSWEPYSDFRFAFNIYAVFAPSAQNGTDNPCDSVYVNTVLESSLNTFNSGRYLTVTDIPRLRNIVAGVPYDQICVLVNSEEYGGGGIYNLFTIFTTDNQNAAFLLHHEFGHAFASLADEYYTSPVTFRNVFNLNIEPYQPNITTLVDFDKKWNNLLSDTIPVPTPDTAVYKDVIGLFEGAAYSKKGIYRPSLDCSMKSISCNNFCPVCKRAIIEMIRFNGYSNTGGKEAKSKLRYHTNQSARLVY
jgi:hypothetical protein